MSACAYVYVGKQRSVSNVLTVSCPWAIVPSLRVSPSPLALLSLKSIAEQDSHGCTYTTRVKHRQVPHSAGEPSIRLAKTRKPKIDFSWVLFCVGIAQNCIYFSFLSEKESLLTLRVLHLQQEPRSLDATVMTDCSLRITFVRVQKLTKWHINPKMIKNAECLNIHPLLSACRRLSSRTHFE